MRKGTVILLISLLVLAVFLVGCREQVGEAFRKIGIPIRRPVIVAPVISPPVQDGCNLKINQESVWLTNSEPDCESVFIALSFNGRTDFYRLLSVLGYQVNESKVLDTGNNLSIYYKTDSDYDYFSDIRNNKYSSNRCEDIYFFGIRLYCFNRIGTAKPNNLIYAIPYFTVLRYTSNVNHENMLVNQVTNAYDFILDNGIVYYDGSSPSFYGETLATVKCEPHQGAANHQDRAGKSFVFVCAKMLNAQALMNKLHYAGILYHEANHKYQRGHSYKHVEDDKYSPEQLMGITIRSDCIRLDGGGRRDEDFASVYGAHINYLFSMSQNDILDCGEQLDTFNEAEREMKLKLCQRPRAPSHGFARPVCS